MSFYPIGCTGTYVMQEKPLLPLYARLYRYKTDMEYQAVLCGLCLCIWDSLTISYTLPAPAPAKPLFYQDNTEKLWHHDHRLQKDTCNIQKKAQKIGYTAASDQYFATKQRLAYHPADKTFNGYGLKANGSAQQAPPPPPPPPKVETKPAPAPAKSKGTMPKGFNAESAPKPKPAPAPAQTKPQGTLPKGFTAKPAPAPQPAKAKGTLPKGF